MIIENIKIKESHTKRPHIINLLKLYTNSIIISVTISTVRIVLKEQTNL